MIKQSWNKKHPREFLNKYPTEQDYLNAYPGTVVRTNDFLKGFVAAFLVIIFLHIGFYYFILT